MPRFTRRRAAVLALAVVGGLALGYRLLRERPSEGEVVLTAELFWVPGSAEPDFGWGIVNDGKTLTIRVRNVSSCQAKLFDLRYRHSDRVSLHSARGGFIVEPELRDHLGRPVLVVGGSPSIMPASHFDAASVVADARPVYELGPWQVGVPDRLGRHFAGKPPAFGFAPGQSFDEPFKPYPMYVYTPLLDPGAYTVVALVTWLDATTNERKQFRSEPIGFEFSADERERCKARQEAVWTNTCKWND